MSNATTGRPTADRAAEIRTRGFVRFPTEEPHENEGGLFVYLMVEADPAGELDREATDNADAGCFIGNAIVIQRNDVLLGEHPAPDLGAVTLDDEHSFHESVQFLNDDSDVESELRDEMEQDARYAQYHYPEPHDLRMLRTALPPHTEGKYSVEYTSFNGRLIRVPESVPYESVTLIGSTNWGAGKEWWICTYEDLTSQGQALFDTMHAGSLSRRARVPANVVGHLMTKAAVSPHVQRKRTDMKGNEWSGAEVRALRERRGQSQTAFGLDLYSTTEGAAQRRVSDLEREERRAGVAEQRTLERMRAGEI